ncbi:MAG: CBS domain-containing protein [Chloroflexota bacterium]|nr:CBS domain-containing protein [Chloroflexota bacterium]
MSSRAAWRLESLGFTRVFDYVAGEADWLAFGLPTEGTNAHVPRAGQVARPDAPACHLTDRLGDVRDRTRAAGWDSCVVINERGIVLGRIRGDALDGNAEQLADAVMRPGPVTVRPSEPLDGLVRRMRERSTADIVVSTSNGMLVGVLRRADAERRLAEETKA